MAEAAKLLNKRTIIYGEAGSGKTRLLAKLLKEFSNILGPSKITIIDLAPPKVGDIGGPLTQYIDVKGFIYLRPEYVYAPRLMACNSEELRRYVSNNVERGRKCFQTYLMDPTELLAVNDITIFLHGADVEELMEYVAMANTFITTAYYGEKLMQDYGTGLSSKERESVEKLLKHFDVAIMLNSHPTS